MRHSEGIQGRRAMERHRLLLPNFTVFVSSLCIMVLELTAGRLVARFLGYSLDVWTSVIGIVLTGIALGNSLGGRIADRFAPRRTLATLFLLASLGSAAVPFLNQMVGRGMLYLQVPWSVKILFHITILFLLPSMVLGMIGPVVAKWALAQGVRTGRTVGDVYAWSAVGSIVGTFLTGFLLIPLMGTVAILGTIAVVLACLGLLFLLRNRFSSFWFLVMALLGCIVLGFGGWAFAKKGQLLFSLESNPHLLYDRESRYSHIRVISLAEAPEMRILELDNSTHSKVDIRDPADITSPHQYDYIKMYASLTTLAAAQKKTLRVLVLGGGGYVMPHYIERHWPGSSIEVAEIDSEVTEAAMRVLGLPRDPSMHIVHLDARNHVEDLLRRKSQGEVVGNFDLIYGDTFNDVAVPFQLTTFEFNEKLRELLSHDGMYMLNLVDTFSSGRFLGAVWNTLRKSFPHVYLFSTEKGITQSEDWSTFVVLSSLRPLDFGTFDLKGVSWKLLNASEVAHLEKRSKGLVLTDNYAPVENLLAPVARQRGNWVARLELGRQLAYETTLLMQQGRFEEALARNRRALTLNPILAEGVHYHIAVLLARQGKWDEAIAEYHEALRQRPHVAAIHIGLAHALFTKGRFEEATREYQEALRLNPHFAEALAGLGSVMFRQGEFEHAAGYYREALRRDPQNVVIYTNLGSTLARQGKFAEAIEQFKEALRIDPYFTPAQLGMKWTEELQQEASSQAYPPQSR